MTPQNLGSFLAICGSVALLTKVGFAPSVEAQDSAGIAAEMLEAVRARYAPLRSFRARFEQRYVHRLHAHEDRWRGRLWLRASGAFRVEYQAPRGRMIVGDGATITTFDPEPAPGLYWVENLASAPLARAFAVLAGRTSASDEFDARVVDASARGFAGVVLELRPRLPLAFYDRAWIYLDASPEHRGVVHRVMLIDRAGNTNRFELFDQAENVGMSDALFVFAPPAGARLVEP